MLRKWYNDLSESDLVESMKRRGSEYNSLQQKCKCKQLHLALKLNSPNRKLRIVAHKNTIRLGADNKTPGKTMRNNRPAMKFNVRYS